jgi:Fe2+ transport system protein B
MIEGKKLNPVQKEAMLKVCSEIMGEMDGIMGEGLDAKKGVKKVAVMADSKEGLEEGLEEAEEVVEGEDLDSDEDISMLSEDEIDAKIQELMALKKQKSVKAPF